MTPSSDKTAQIESEKANKTSGSPVPSSTKAAQSGGLFRTSAVGSLQGFMTLAAAGSSFPACGKTDGQKDSFGIEVQSSTFDASVPIKDRAMSTFSPQGTDQQC